MRYWPWTMTTVIERRADAEVWVTEKVTGVRIARRGWAPTEVAKLSQSMKWAHVTKWSANHDGFFKNVVIVCIILRRCQTSSSLFSTFLFTQALVVNSGDTTNFFCVLVFWHPFCCLDMGLLGRFFCYNLIKLINYALKDLMILQDSLSSCHFTFLLFSLVKFLFLWKKLWCQNNHKSWLRS